MCCFYLQGNCTQHTLMNTHMSFVGLLQPCKVHGHVTVWASIICMCLKVHILVYTNGHAGVQVRSREPRYYSKQYMTQK
jgi:hypothetical protein